MWLLVLVFGVATYRHKVNIMKRILLSLLLILCASFSAYAQGTSLCYTVNGIPCGNPGIQASNSNPINITTTTTTQIITLDTNKAIYITHWDVMAGGTGTIKWVTGAGTNCAIAQTDLTGPYPLVAQAGISAGNGTGPVIVVPKGKAACLTTNANIQYSGNEAHVQF